MSSHTIRDLPARHAQHTLRPYFGYPKNAVKGKFRFLPITEISYIGANGTNGHRKEHGKFEKLGGETLRWGMFNRQVYRAAHPLMDGLDVLLKKDQKFIIAWRGNIVGDHFRPLSLWKGLAKSNNYTHYQLIADVVSNYRTISVKSDDHPEWANPKKASSISRECVFVRRELIDRQLALSKN